MIKRRRWQTKKAATRATQENRAQFALRGEDLPPPRECLYGCSADGWISEQRADGSWVSRPCAVHRPTRSVAEKSDLPF